MIPMENFLKTFLYPHPSVAKDSLTLEIIYKRNKATCLYFVLSYVFFILFIMSSNQSLINHPNIFIHASLLINTILFVLTCSKRISCFKEYYTLNSIISGFVFLKSYEGYFYGLFDAYLSPFFILKITKSRLYSISILALKSIYLNLVMWSHFEGFQIEVRDPEALHSLMLTGALYSTWTIFLFVIHGASYDRTQEMLVQVQQYNFAQEKQRDFLLSLSHELRNPLNVLLGNLQLAVSEKNPQKVYQYLEDAEISGNMLNFTLTNILDGGKVERDGLEITPKPTNVRNLFEKIWKIANNAIEQKNLFGCIRLSRTVPQFLQIDEARVTQVLLNLISNAIKFTDRGKVSAKIEWVENVREVVDVHFSPIPYDCEDEGIFEKDELIQYLTEDNFEILSTQSRSFLSSPVYKPKPEQKGVLKIIVTDTGCGIQPQDLGKIFQMFNKINPEGRMIGTGIGLYVSKEICRKMGGEIRAYSQLKKGSTFIVCIPTKTVSMRTDSIMNIGSLTGSRTSRALVVDDIKFNVQVIEKFLKKYGVAETDHAINGKEAVEKYIKLFNQGNFVNLITMDYDMPEMNGVEAIQKIREFERINEIRPAFIIMIRAMSTRTF